MVSSHAATVSRRTSEDTRASLQGSAATLPASSSLSRRRASAIHSAWSFIPCNRRRSVADRIEEANEQLDLVITGQVERLFDKLRGRGWHSSLFNRPRH